MLNFRELEIEGFGSIVDRVIIKFSDHGLTLIKGKNGAGKTTIFSALSWVNYGKTLKEKSDVTTWEHIRPSTYKGVKVTTRFTSGKIDVCITRCEGYSGKVEGSKGGNRLILHINGVLFPSKDKKIIQAEIDRLIGMSFDLFINSIIFGQKMKRIIEATGPNQKKIFDEAFEVNYVNVAKKNVENDYKEMNRKHQELVNSKNLLTSKIDSTRELIKNSKDAEKDFETLKNERVSKLEKERYTKDSAYEVIKTDKLTSDKRLSELNSEMIKLNLNEVEAKVTEHNNVISEISKVNIKEGLKLKELSQLENEISKVPIECDKCGSKLNPKTVDNTKQNLLGKKIIVKASIKSLVKERTKLELRANKLSKIVKSNQKVISKHKELENLYLREKYKNQQLAKDALNIITELETLAKDILEIKASKRKKVSKGYRSELKKLKTQLKPINEALTKTSEDIDLFNWLIKDPLSNSGLKTYIFNSMLNTINEQLFQYSRILGFEVEFGINMESARREFYSLVAKDGNVIPFNDLSGGQQQLVNIAIAFAIHHVVNQNHNINILIMDELFESLDSDNIDVVSELIQLKASTKDLYLITHQKEFNPPNSKAIHLNLQKSGVTKVV